MRLRKEQQLLNEEHLQQRFAKIVLKLRTNFACHKFMIYLRN